MPVLNADALLEGIPFLSKRSRGSLPSIRTTEWTKHSISFAAKVAVCALICTNLVQLVLLSAQSSFPCESDPRPPAPKAVPAASDIYSAEMLMSNLPEVVRQAIGAPMPFPDRHFAVFIIFSWNFPLFWTSLQTYMAAGWGRRVIILDNSVDHRILNDPLVRQMVGEVIPTRVQLTFSQCQNFISDISAERNYTYHFWGHADVALQASSPKQSFAEEVLDCMDQIDAAKPEWGIAYFHYDWFSVTRHPVDRDLRYDTFITVYMSDCDYYPRVRQAGFETLDAESVCGAVPSVYDMKGHMELPLDDYDKTKEALEGIQITEWDRNGWKWTVWGIGEQIGWELWELTTRQYYRYKWGLEKDIPAHSCKLEVEGPDGEKRPRQEPFETMQDIYVPLSRTSGKDLDETPGQVAAAATAAERRSRIF